MKEIESESILSSVAPNSLPFFYPFFDTNETVDRKKLLSFLKVNCQTKPNKVRALFIQLISKDEEVVDLGSYFDKNHWKREEKLQSLKQLVEVWGYKGTIDYWQMY